MEPFGARPSTAIFIRRCPKNEKAGGYCFGLFFKDAKANVSSRERRGRPIAKNGAVEFQYKAPNKPIAAF
jgi:hypothetical protein